MRHRNHLDGVDRKIISLICEYPDIPQKEVSKRLSLSQSTVATRLARLKREGLARQSYGLNVRKLHLSVCRVDASMPNLASLASLAKKCPLLVNAHFTTAGRNASLLFVVESDETLGQIVNEHIRTLEGLNDLEVSVIYDSVQPLFLRVSPERHVTSNPPCGIMPFCSGCPSSVAYKGRFWSYGK